eukprot:TRINITY_DN49116_c0_g1_i1.p1 TRINITY_DN49116_c0_g1~~TRINITY_DN49116_c0_g1_i1.p1  ORF type:complete len:525 (-),score=46.22 TRINITY_DN49116_c0_g1_i1:48-1571(-)
MARRQELLQFEASDYYAYLNLDDAASPANVRKHFRQLALKWHPDKHAEGAARVKAGEIFKKVNEAHEVLIDPAQRARYDLVWGRVHRHSQRSVPSWARNAGQLRGSGSVEPGPRRGDSLRGRSGCSVERTRGKSDYHGGGATFPVSGTPAQAHIPPVEVEKRRNSDSDVCSRSGAVFDATEMWRRIDTPRMDTPRDPASSRAFDSRTGSRANSGVPEAAQDRQSPSFATQPKPQQAGMSSKWSNIGEATRDEKQRARSSERSRQKDPPTSPSSQSQFQPRPRSKTRGAFSSTRPAGLHSRRRKMNTAFILEHDGPPTPMSTPPPSPKASPRASPRVSPRPSPEPEQSNFGYLADLLQGAFRSPFENGSTVTAAQRKEDADSVHPKKVDSKKLSDSSAGWFADIPWVSVPPKLSMPSAPKAFVSGLDESAMDAAAQATATLAEGVQRNLTTVIGAASATAAWFQRASSRPEYEYVSVSAPPAFCPNCRSATSGHGSNFCASCHHIFPS